MQHPHYKEKSEKASEGATSSPSCSDISLLRMPLFSYRLHDQLRHQEGIHGRKLAVEVVFAPKSEEKEKAAPPQVVGKSPSEMRVMVLPTTGPKPLATSPLMKTSASKEKGAITIRYKALEGVQTLPHPFPVDPKLH